MIHIIQYPPCMTWQYKIMQLGTVIKEPERLCQYGAGTPFTISPGISYAGITDLGYSLACTAVPPPTQKGAIQSRCIDSQPQPQDYNRLQQNHIHTQTLHALYSFETKGFPIVPMYNNNNNNVIVLLDMYLAIL